MFFTFKRDAKRFKGVNKLPGTTVVNSSHAFIAIHTSTATRHVMNKWGSDSSSIGHHTQQVLDGATIIRRFAKFTRVGNLCNNNCHEKIITFNGAKLSQFLFNTRQ
jgi:hypothetical protein